MPSLNRRYLFNTISSASRAKGMGLMLRFKEYTTAHGKVDLSEAASLAEFVDYYLSFLHQKLASKYKLVDEHLLDASIEDALLRHLACPERFDAARGTSLLSYLELWTRSYLDKRLRKVKCRQKHEQAVGVSGENFEKIVSENRMERGICLQTGKKLLEEWGKALDAIVARLNPRDRAEVQLLRDGDSFEEWVRHLRIEHLPFEEQRHKVNAEKDRLKKKLKRRVESANYG
jgi:hypothetical protein